MVTIMVPVVFIIIPLAMLVPAVIVLKPAMLSFPVTFIIPAALIVRGEPPGSGIRCTSPVAFMPLPVVSYGIPITVDPNIIGTGLDRTNTFEASRGRRTDLNANRNLSAKGGYAA
jgi:hypothetical protein